MKRKREKRGDLIDGSNNDNDSSNGYEISNDSDGDGDGGGESSFSEMEINNNGNDIVERSQETGKEPPQETGKEPERVVPVRPDGVIQRPPTMAVYGRVRVKLKTAAKPQPQPQIQPQLQLQPEPEPQRGVVEAEGGGDEGVSNRSEVDKSMEEVKVEKTEDGGVGSGDKVVVVVESGNPGSSEGMKSGGLESKVVSLKSSNTSPRVGGEEGVSIGSEVDEIMEDVRVDKTDDGVGSGEKEVVAMEIGNSVSAESKKSGGIGVKIVSSKSLSLSPPSGSVGNVKETIGSGVLPKEDVDDGLLMEDSGKFGLAEGKKFTGMGIKIVSSKSSNLSPPTGGDGNLKESGGGKMSPKADIKESELVDEGGKSGLAEVKKSGGIGIKIVSSKSSNLTPPGGDGNVKESGVGRLSPKADIKESEFVEERGKPGSTEGKNSGGMGIKILSSKSSNSSPSGGAVDVKESGEGKGLSKADVEEGELVEVSGNSGSAEGKKFDGVGIKIVSSKSSNLNPPTGGDGNVKESGGGKMSPKADIKESELVDASGKSGLAEVKKSGGIGIKIVSSKSSNLTPPGGDGNVKEGDGGRLLPKADIKESEFVEERGKLGSTEGKNSSGMGIKILSSKSSNSSPSGGSVHVKESGEGRGFPKADVEGELVEASESLRSAEGKKFDGTGIKIVSSKSSNLSPPGGGIVKESCGSRVLPKAGVEEGGLAEVKVKEEKPKSFNLQELEASLEVIKKVMRMDGAGPFIAPVNPIELGIPDYFDVIDTPMDFGTIRNNLESRTKYMDSEDVYKDAQYVWDNCFKYNNKGDYIVDLMKRVKKNFMKYWVAAGLYTEQTKKMTGEGTGADEPTTSGNAKKLKKGKGYMLHKEDCLCAICIRRRRRREREAREAEEARAAGIILPSPQIRVTQTNMAGGYKQEENLYAESPGENTSSYMATSPGGDGDADMEDEEIRLESIASQFYNQPKAAGDRILFPDKYGRSRDISETLLRNDKGVIELYTHDNTGSRMMIDTPKHPSVHPEGPAPEYLKQRNEQVELERKRQRLRLLETFRDLENPMLGELCGTLFPNNVQSVWNGANSLLQGKKSHHQKSGIHEAVASFVRPSCKFASSPN